MRPDKGKTRPRWQRTTQYAWIYLTSDATAIGPVLSLFVNASGFYDEANVASTPESAGLPKKSFP